MDKFDFTAIDFETMTADATSACAIGIVRVEKGIIVQKFYSLIKPVPDQRTSNNSHVHGITPEMVQDAPTFAELWPVIERYFTNQWIVGHNVGFDLHVLDKTTDYYNIMFPIYDTFDTYSITRKNLPDSCAICGIDLSDHHDALCDATASAQILMASMGYCPSVEKREDFFNFEIFDTKKMKKDTLVPLDDSEVECKDTPFFHKRVVLTGTLANFPRRDEIANILKEFGADINTSISGKTDIVIAGSGAGPSKMEKIERLKNSGCDICVMDENKLMEILNKYLT